MKTILGLACAVALGCSATRDGSGFGDDGHEDGSSGDPGGTGSGGLFSSGNGSGGSGLAVEPACDPQDLGADGDGDGWSTDGGDCNDCTPLMNPGAYDFVGNAIDEDCNGADDDELESCDGGLPIAGDDAMDAARAMELCRMQQGESWGVVDAKWMFPDGTQASSPVGGCVVAGAPPNPQSRGILTSFGTSISPRAGSSMVAISSGVARAGDMMATPPAMGLSPDGAQMCAGSNSPPGFPKDSPACPTAQTASDTRAFDAMALEIRVKTPTNAKSLSFDFDFYTVEWPNFVCTSFNDFFVALLESQHPATPADKNVSFDSQGNAVSVNNGLMEVCDPAIGATNPGGKSFPCPLGAGQLGGTGFDPDHAATSWLVTTANIQPGETIALRFGIWDMGDEILDSTALLDNVAWDVEPGETGPITEPVPK